MEVRSKNYAVYSVLNRVVIASYIKRLLVLLVPLVGPRVCVVMCTAWVSGRREVRQISAFFYFFQFVSLFTRKFEAGKIEMRIAVSLGKS